ncbi:MAG: ABC transporter substrate-binding protein [Coriobacteriales bacterium]
MNARSIARKAPRVLIASLIALALAACALIASGCSAQEEQGGPKELKAGSTTYFYAESMDPASEWDSWYLSYYGIMENLFKVSDDLTPEPWLAESAVSVDDKTWTVKVKDGISFSNGEPVDAAAVKAAWERTSEENSRAAETLAIESITAEGQELTVVTKEPVTDFENTLCDPLLCVYYTGEGVDYAAETPGTGPYKMVDFVAEDHITLEPNAEYWDGTPKLDRVELITFTDDNTLTMAMQNGEIDAIAMPSASARATLAGDGYQTFTRVTSRADFIRMNMSHPLIANDAVRAAIAYCIDRDSYSNVLCQGSAVPSWGVYSETLPFGGTEGLDIKVSEFSVEKAKDVLDEAGIVDSDGDGVRELDGTPVELSLYTCTSYERFVLEADDLQSNLAEAGIKIDIVPTDYFIEDFETFDNDDPDMCFNSNAMAPTGNQAYFANSHFASSGSSNLGRYSNAEVDALIEELNATVEAGARNDLARRIAQQVIDDNSFIFFANPDACVIAREGVSGLDAAPSEYYFVTVDADVE